MMKENKNVLIFFLVLSSLISFTGCGTIMNGVAGGQPQPISGAVEIGPEWKEIIPPEPLKAERKIQYVSLKMPESVWKDANWDETDPERKTLKYPDGRRGKIEAILYDDRGESYDLIITGKGNGFDLGRKAPPRDPDAPPINKPVFPSDRAYTKLRIRSDLPLSIERIEWAGYNPK